MQTSEERLLQTGDVVRGSLPGGPAAPSAESAAATQPDKRAAEPSNEPTVAVPAPVVGEIVDKKASETNVQADWPGFRGSTATEFFAAFKSKQIGLASRPLRYGVVR